MHVTSVVTATGGSDVQLTVNGPLIDSQRSVPTPPVQPRWPVQGAIQTGSSGWLGRAVGPLLD